MDWWHVLWFGYFWSSIKGNGPEAIAQTVVYAAIGVYFIPKVRHWVNQRFIRLHTKLDAHHRDHQETLIMHHAEKMESDRLIHAQLAHIIKHSKDIPEFTDPKGTPND